jgi:hypothetical protein
MTKVDIKKELKDLYASSASAISVVNVPKMNFIMIDGLGDPGKSKEYKDAIEALYSISYTLKFMVKKDKEIDYGVMPLEGLWWMDDMTQFTAENKDIWKWTSMIMQPECISTDMYGSAIKKVEKTKKLPGLAKARFESFQEGLSGQIMYIGPFSDEGPAIQKLHKFLKNEGYSFDGLKQKHHEIYLSDFRKTAPEKLKTIIRQAVVK